MNWFKRLFKGKSLQRLEQENKFEKEIADTLLGDVIRKMNECEDLKKKIDKTRIQHDIIATRYMNLQGECDKKDAYIHKANAEIARLHTKSNKERILCAANYYNDGNIHTHQPKNISRGYVVCGRRHHNCIMTFAHLIVGFPYNDFGHAIHQTEEQGFLTTTDRWVDRQEAYKIAFEADQIIGPNKGCPTNSIGLTSEDVW